MQDDADLMLPEESAQASLEGSGEGSGGSDEIQDDEAQVRLSCHAMPCNAMQQCVCTVACSASAVRDKGRLGCCGSRLC